MAKKKYRKTGLRQFLADSLHISVWAVDKRIARADPETIELASTYTRAWEKSQKKALIVKETLNGGNNATNEEK